MLILGGLVDDKLAVGYVDWGLLLLIGSAHGFSKSVVNSGLAGMVGGAIRESGIGPSSSVFCLFGFTMVSPEEKRKGSGNARCSGLLSGAETIHPCERFVVGV